MHPLDNADLRFGRNADIASLELPPHEVIVAIMQRGRQLRAEAARDLFAKMFTKPKKARKSKAKRHGTDQRGVLLWRGRGQ